MAGKSMPVAQKLPEMIREARHFLSKWVMTKKYSTTAHDLVSFWVVDEGFFPIAHLDRQFALKMQEIDKKWAMEEDFFTIARFY